MIAGRTAIGSLLFAALIGCSAGTEGFSNSTPPSEGESTPVDDAVDLRFYVVPSQTQVPGTEGEASSPVFRALPQTFVRSAAPGSVDLRIGTLRLQPPVVQTGNIIGYKINPLVVALPGGTQPVDAQVRISQPASLQSYVAYTDESGDFSVWAVPQADYLVQVIPDDPMLAMYSGTFEVAPDPQAFNLDLGVGAPIYGRVTAAGFGLTEARVRAVDAYGVTSTVAYTDGSGLYQLRVTPGTWRVLCDGRDNGRDPTLDLGVVEVPEEGAVVDVAYPVMPTTFVEGRIEDGNGKVIEDATVRLVFESADGFSELAASWTGEDETDAGGFLVGAISGTYTVEVIPNEDVLVDKYSPKRLTGQAFTQPKVSLRVPIELDPLTLVTGQVFAEATGFPLASAHVVCAEIGFGERSFGTFTEVDGVFYLETSNVPQRCEIIPPSDADGLAAIRRTIDPAVQSSGYDFTLPPGTSITGTVSLNDVPEPYAVVEVWRDDVRLGTSLTLGDGRFEIQVDLSE